MKIKFKAILSLTASLEAVKQNGYALQYVLSRKLFIAISKRLGIDTDQN